MTIQGKVPARPAAEFDGSADQTVHRTAEAAIADEHNDDEKVCCLCGEPIPEDRVMLRKRDAYVERINYSHYACLQEAMQYNGEN